MRTSNVLISALHLIIVMFVFAIGAFFVAIYFYPKLLFLFVELIINKPGIILKIGFSSLLLSGLLFFGFYFINKAQYIKFSMKRNNFQVDTTLIKSSIEKYFKNAYPKMNNKLEVNVIPKDKLEIIATVDSLDNQKEFLLNIEDKVGKLLSEHLDYQKEFVFTIKSRK